MSLRAVGRDVARKIQQDKAAGFERATGGMNYLKLARMAYYVDMTTYLGEVGKLTKALKQEAA